MSATSSHWPLVGRDDELRYLSEALDQPHLNGVVLVGPPGVGKTRLARELMAAATGSVQNWIIATRAAAGVPLAPVAYLLPGEDGVEGPDRLRLFRRAATALAERAAGHRLIVGVDDAHLLDPASAALVLHLAVTGVATVVATVRTGEPAPDAVSALWKDGVALRLDVQALSEAETRAMVTAAMGGHLERATSAWLFEATQGNPLFVRELVTAALDAGTLLRGAGGTWRWSGEMVASPRLVETVEARLASVQSAGREVLELLALGEPLHLEVLESIVSSDAVGEMEAAGFVALSRDGEPTHVRLAHPLYGQVLRASMPRTTACRRYRLLADSADVTQASGTSGGDDLLRQVVWRLEAGSPSKPDDLTEAAHRANRRFDHCLARRLARRALDAGAGMAAVVILAEACNEQNCFAEAEDVLAPWEAEASGAIDERLAERYLLQRMQALHWGLGRTDDAKEYLERAGGARDERSWRDLVRAMQAQLMGAEGHLDEAFALAVPLVRDPGVERLLLSVRTVESHLYRTYAKLGVHRREELKALVR